jgi:hypothetical protein
MEPVGQQYFNIFFIIHICYILFKIHVRPLSGVIMKFNRGKKMKIQILADDDTVLETIQDVHISLKTQNGMGALLDKLLSVYKQKYMAYMWEKYNRDRRSGEDRRQNEEDEQSDNRFSGERS